jgi:hypothetical protein
MMMKITFKEVLFTMILAALAIAAFVLTAPAANAQFYQYRQGYQSIQAYAPVVTYQPVQVCRPVTIVEPYTGPLAVRTRWHLGKNLGRAWRAGSGRYVPPRWTIYDQVQLVPMPYPAPTPAS